MFRRNFEADEDKIMADDRSKSTNTQLLLRLNSLNSIVRDPEWNDLMFRCRERKQNYFPNNPIK